MNLRIGLAPFSYFKSEGSIIERLCKWIECSITFPSKAINSQPLLSEDECKSWISSIDGSMVLSLFYHCSGISKRLDQ